ncbi:transposase [Clostridium algidicarnis]|uniref:transposase n=1 Tax=Clostridium algidicarnis TaxID=37659 RepID=UPI0016279335|nr:transposase [Clostridium algidicarnis]MBB6698713.1 transposase [Clostridium algidicarnis]
MYACPNLRALHYKTTIKGGYKEYVGNAKDCKECPNRAKCFSYKSSLKPLENMFGNRVKKVL